VLHNSMNVVLVNTWDIFGGASRAAHRLYNGLRQAGVETTYLVNDKRSSDGNIQELKKQRCERGRQEGAVQRNYIEANRSSLSNTYFSFTWNGAALADNPWIRSANIINLHWVEKFVSNRSLCELATLGKPVVWTLHDQRPFTGGCHYASGCNGFISGCIECRQLRQDAQHLPEKVVAERMDIMADMDLTIVTPSKWLADAARSSRLFRDKRVEVIPNSVETDLFSPLDKTQAKSQLAIGENVVTLMFGAQHNREIRKGFRELMESLRLCLQDDRFRQACETGTIQIISIGDKGSDIEKLPIRSNNFGYIEDDRRLAQLYSATDLFILPSLEDNLPNSLLEAMACGTPIAAFATGGVPDMLKHERNGMLAETRDTRALANAILALVFDAEKRKVFGEQSRALIEAGYRLQDQAGNYSALFRSLLDSTPGRVNVPAPACTGTRTYDAIFDIALQGPLVLDERGRIAKYREKLSNYKWFLRSRYVKLRKMFRH